MSSKNAKVIRNAEVKWFIVMNQKAQFFSGLEKGGLIKFSDEYSDAKPLSNPECIPTIERHAKSKVELLYI